MSLTTLTLAGQYSILVASESKNRKRLFIETTLTKTGNYKTQFNVRVVNTHHRFNCLSEAIELYNSIGKEKLEEPAEDDYYIPNEF